MRGRDEMANAFLPLDSRETLYVVLCAVPAFHRFEPQLKGAKLEGKFMRIGL
jgi:hypothetical protein